MLIIAETVQAILVPFMTVIAALLGLVFASLFIRRVVGEFARRRHQALVERYQPLIRTLAQAGSTPETVSRLHAIPAEHRRLVASLLVAPLRVARGDMVSHARGALTELGVIEWWLKDAADSRWWVRAAAVRSLGVIEEATALPAFVKALADNHEDVRAAAVEAIGRLGDHRAIPALLNHLTEPSRYQRLRLVDALRGLGPLVTPALAELARNRHDQTRLAVELLGLIGSVTAIDPLIEWCADERHDVRAAAFGALGTIGLDDRSHYVALKGLTDPDADTRAMAARALGRGRREDAAPYLANHLNDEWLPASRAAEALRRLGGAGLLALQARACDDGQAGDLARQMLWTRPSIGASPP